MSAMSRLKQQCMPKLQLWHDQILLQKTRGEVVTWRAPAASSVWARWSDFRTRLPSAPAALTRVLVSPSLESIATRGATAGTRSPYSSLLWNAAVPESALSRHLYSSCLSTFIQMGGV